MVDDTPTTVGTECPEDSQGLDYFISHWKQRRAKFLLILWFFATKICLKTVIAGEKKTRKTLIHSALLRGTEPLNCGRLISPKANA
jgi:hypothetical protein